MTTKNTFSWDVTPCTDVEIHKFSQEFNASIFSTHSILKMTVARSAQKSIYSYQTRRLHIPKTRELFYSKCSPLIGKYPCVLHLYTIFSLSLYWSPCIPSSIFNVTTRLCSSKIPVTTQYVASSSRIDSPVLRDLSPRLPAVHHSLLILLSQKKNLIRFSNCVSVLVHLLTQFTRNARLAVTSNSCNFDSASPILPSQRHTIVTVPYINFVTLEVTATIYEFRLFKNANTAIAIVPTHGVSMHCS